jgi:general secretion pathway protein D
VPLKLKTTVAILALGALLAGCGHKPMQPDETHIAAGQARPEGTIPPPVQITPVLPKPTPMARPETYSVVVSNVRVQELLFALARDARLQIDIDPSLTGTVTLNAVDQTLPQLLTRIGRQVDMRYELDGQNLVVMRDTPYLRVYRIDYVNLARDAKIVAGMAMQVSGGGSPAGGAAGGQNNSTATINSVSVNKFWDTLIDNIKAILRETDKVLPAGAAAQAATTVPAPQAPASGAAPAPTAALAAPTATFLEAGSVIANPESGLLNIRATARQHETIQTFLDQVLANSRRQVLIEATVAEVRLSSQYQRGIDWQRLRSGAAAAGVPAFGTGNSGLEFSQRSNVARPGFNENPFILGGAITSLNLNFAFKLLESFGDVRVLSSPKLSVLNNQFAVLKVVDNIVYFTVSSSTSQAQTTTLQSFSTTANTVPVGLVMTVVPQISDHDSISLNVRPSISRLLRFVQDPNPALTAVGNFIPEIQTREMESMLRLESGQVAVLGGLMEDLQDRSEDAIPGVRNVPGIGPLFSQRSDESRKTELVIFLRATVIRDPSVEGDYRSLRSLLPREDFMSRPHPGRAAPPVGPMEERPR